MRRRASFLIPYALTFQPDWLALLALRLRGASGDKHQLVVQSRILTAERTTDHATERAGVQGLAAVLFASRLESRATVLVLLGEVHVGTIARRTTFCNG